MLHFLESWSKPNPFPEKEGSRKTWDTEMHVPALCCQLIRENLKTKAKLFPVFLA